MIYSTLMCNILIQ